MKGFIIFLGAGLFSACLLDVFWSAEASTTTAPNTRSATDSTTDISTTNSTDVSLTTKSTNVSSTTNSTNVSLTTNSTDSSTTHNNGDSSATDSTADSSTTESTAVSSATDSTAVSLTTDSTNVSSTRDSPALSSTTGNSSIGSTADTSSPRHTATTSSSTMDNNNTLDKTSTSDNAPHYITSSEATGDSSVSTVSSTTSDTSTTSTSSSPTSIGSIDGTTETKSGRPQESEGGPQKDGTVTVIVVVTVVIIILLIIIGLVAVFVARRKRRGDSTMDILRSRRGLGHACTYRVSAYQRMEGEGDCTIELDNDTGTSPAGSAPNTNDDQGTKSEDPNPSSPNGNPEIPAKKDSFRFTTFDFDDKEGAGPVKEGSVENSESLAAGNTDLEVKDHGNTLHTANGGCLDGEKQDWMSTDRGSKADETRVDASQPHGPDPANDEVGDDPAQQPEDDYSFPNSRPAFFATGQLQDSSKMLGGGAKGEGDGFPGPPADLNSMATDDDPQLSANDAQGASMYGSDANGKDNDFPQPAASLPPPEDEANFI